MYERVLRRHLLSSPRSALVIGPRQVGKSVLLGSLQPEMIVNLAEPAAFREYAARPERLERELAGAGRSVKTVFLDEVQRVPALLDAIQAILDRDPRRVRFLLSGSSARKLRRGHANLLPGRVHLHYLSPLLACELGSDFDPDRALAHGTLPGIYSEADPEVRAADLRSYADVYLREEVQAEALVRNIGGYARLLDLVASMSGKVLNLNALCSDASLSYETARRYFEVLEDTLLVFTVPAWSGSDRASMIQHPKVYLFDIGVRNALLRRPLDRPLADERGLLLEHLVACELHRRLGSIWPEARLFHYRTRSGAEVDFVIEVGRELWAIEVKASTRVDVPDTPGFRSLAERSRWLRRRIVVFMGTRRQVSANVEVLPLDRFLDELPR